MPTKGRTILGKYFDSVTLMMVQKEIAAQPGVTNAAIVMGSKENKAILQAAGLFLPDLAQAGDSDLVIALQAESDVVADKLLLGVEGMLEAVRKKAESSTELRPKSLAGAIKLMPDANLAIISVAGRYAGAEAQKALEQGLHVMLFSDNVPLATEIELKKYAQAKGLLVMGPDCGTAIINGVPLAFANVVRRGHIGIVAASGTGLQEVSCIIANEGAGVSQAIGTGGRDVKEAVGGIMFLAGLAALAQDPATQVMLLVSKPPHATVLAKIQEQLAQSDKPVVTVFLGAQGNALKGQGIYNATTLEEAAMLAVALANKSGTATVKRKLAAADRRLQKQAQTLAASVKPGQRYVRGLFSGGTFCSEAQLILQKTITPIYSNVPVANAHKLADSLKSQEHTLVDLGEDEFTVGRPHPMIDFSLRNKRMVEEAQDCQTAVILLDVVLGYGSHKDPAAELSPIIQKIHERVPVVCSITGTDQDPQHKPAVAKSLAEAGALVMTSNAAAARLSGYIVQRLQYF